MDVGIFRRFRRSLRPQGLESVRSRLPSRRNMGDEFQMPSVSKAFYDTCCGQEIVRAHFAEFHAQMSDRRLRGRRKPRVHDRRAFRVSAMWNDNPRLKAVRFAPPQRIARPQINAMFGGRVTRFPELAGSFTSKTCSRPLDVANTCSTGWNLESDTTVGQVYVVIRFGRIRQRIKPKMAWKSFKRPKRNC